jgi:hypothetical protein
MSAERVRAAGDLAPVADRAECPIAETHLANT